MVGNECLGVSKVEMSKDPKIARKAGLNTGRVRELTNSDFTSSIEDPGRGFKHKSHRLDRKIQKIT